MDVDSGMNQRGTGTLAEAPAEQAESAFELCLGLTDKDTGVTYSIYQSIVDDFDQSRSRFGDVVTAVQTSDSRRVSGPRHQLEYLVRGPFRHFEEGLFRARAGQRDDPPTPPASTRVSSSPSAPPDPPGLSIERLTPPTGRDPEP